MKAIIVDDEPKAIELLSSYLQHFGTIELAGTFRNGIKAFEYVSKEKVDIIFLDINMPHISGISLSRMIPKSVKIIFTTAYSEYAVESYEVEALDYLVKPVSLDRFAQCIRKLLSRNESHRSPDTQWVYLRSGFDTYRIATDQILFLEKEGNYMNYHCAKEKILTRETVQEALDKLPAFFVQSHKSFIINSEKVKRFDRYYLQIEQHKIPISDSYRESIFEKLSIS